MFASRFAYRPSRLFLVMGLVTGIMSSGYGVMFTVLDNFRSKYHISSGSLGLVVGVGFLAGFAAQVTLGPLADHGHARQLVFIGTLTSVVGTIVIAFGTGLFQLVAGRFLMGIGVGMSSPAIRRILILAEPEKIGQNLGRLLSIDVAGFAVGPIVSAILVGPFGLRAPFLVIAGGTLILVPVIARTHVDEHSVEAGASRQRFAFDLLTRREIVGALCFGVALMTMIGTFDSMWSFVMDDLHAQEWIANVGITLFALPLIFLGPVGGRMVQKYGPFRLAASGLLVGSLFICAYGLLSVPILMLCVGVFHGINDGLTVSGAGVGIGMIVPADRQAGAQGLLGGAQTLAGGLSAIVAARSYQSFGRTNTFLGCALVMVALVALGSWLCGTSMRMTAPKPSVLPERGVVQESAKAI